MFVLPIGDAPNFAARRPWMTWTLLAMQFVVHAWLSTLDPVGRGDIMRRLGHVPIAPELHSWCTYAFLHGGWLHLGLNGIALWVFGDNVEARLGSIGFLVAYVACGVAGALLFDLAQPSSSMPLVGSSAAVFGIMGLYVWLFPKNRIRFLLWFFAFVFLWAPVRLVIGGLVALDVLLWLRTRIAHVEPDGVAHAAHVGGFAAGWLLAFVLRRLQPSNLPVHSRASRAPGGARVMLESAAYFERRGERAMAESLYLAVLRDHVGLPEAATAAYRLGVLLDGIEVRRVEAQGYFQHAYDMHPDPVVRARAGARLSSHP